MNEGEENNQHMNEIELQPNTEVYGTNRNDIV